MKAPGLASNTAEHSLCRGIRRSDKTPSNRVSARCLMVWGHREPRAHPSMKFAQETRSAQTDLERPLEQGSTNNHGTQVPRLDGSRTPDRQVKAQAHGGVHGHRPLTWAVWPPALLHYINCSHNVPQPPCSVPDSGPDRERSLSTILRGLPLAVSRTGATKKRVRKKEVPQGSWRASVTPFIGPVTDLCVSEFAVDNQSGRRAKPVRARIQGRHVPDPEGTSLQCADMWYYGRCHNCEHI